MIAAVTKSLATNALPINWFDAALVVLLGVGIFRGRKNGMTKELVPTVQWLAVVIAAGLAYDFVADFYAGQCGLKSKLWSALLGYLSITAIILMICSYIRKSVKTWQEAGGSFGGSEYYFGMGAGMLRYACMTVFALALLNARSYSAAEIAAKKAYNERWYGGGIYSGNYIPDLHTAQDSVFKQSFCGPYIQNYLGMLLIQTGPGSGGPNTDSKTPHPVIHIGK